jgi:hypothetical protein
VVSGKKKKPRMTRMNTKMESPFRVLFAYEPTETEMTSDGISDSDWDRLSDLAREVVESVDCAEDHESAEQRLLKFLDELEKRYGKRPSILATRADYVDGVRERVTLLEEAYELARAMSDSLNRTLIASSLAQLFIEELEDHKSGRIWVDELGDCLAMRWDDGEHREYLRLIAKLD